MLHFIGSTRELFFPLRLYLNSHIFNMVKSSLTFQFCNLSIPGLFIFPLNSIFILASSFQSYRTLSYAACSSHLGISAIDLKISSINMKSSLGIFSILPTIMSDSITKHLAATWHRLKFFPLFITSFTVFLASYYNMLVTCWPVPKTLPSVLGFIIALVGSNCVSDAA